MPVLHYVGYGCHAMCLLSSLLSRMCDVPVRHISKAAWFESEFSHFETYFSVEEILTTGIIIAELYYWVGLLFS